MTNLVEVIIKTLRADTTLMNMLPANKPYSGSATPAKKFSVIPAGLASGETLTPFILVQQGVAPRVGMHLKHETVYIRVYDLEINAVAQIDNVHRRIEALLDKTNLALEGGRAVQFRLDGYLAMTEDPDLDKNFVEAQYRLEVL